MYNIIPNNIYQAWSNRSIMPPSIIESTNNIKINNPEFNYYLYDEYECREFINKNFSDEIKEVYDILAPSAYKTDMWRYCILYLNGGIYLDSKFCVLNNFKLINLLKHEIFCQEIKDVENNVLSVYNGIIITKPKNDILYQCILQICENVKNNFYGNSSLDPTGPVMMKQFISDQILLDSDLKFLTSDNAILYQDFPILKIHENYRYEMSQIASTSWHYTRYWNERKIYRTI